MAKKEKNTEKNSQTIKNTEEQTSKNIQFVGNRNLEEDKKKAEEDFEKYKT